MDKEIVVYIHNGILFSHKKERMKFAICDKLMDLEGVMLSEISQRQIPYDFSYMWNLKNRQTNKQKKLLNMENRLVVARGWGVRGEGNA